MLTKITPGYLFWLTGLSGSGKTTIGLHLTTILRNSGYSVIFLDGDHLREVTGNLFGHTREERLKAAFLYARLCKTLVEQGAIVVCATISLFHEVQAWNREHIPGYIEIFIDVPLTELIQRDSKQIYAKVQNGEIRHVVGIDIAADYPLQPNLTVSNISDTNPAEAAKAIYTYWIKEHDHGCIKTN